LQEIKGYIEETAKHNKARETTPTTFPVIHIKSNQKPCLETTNNQEHLDKSEASSKKELKTENKPEPRRYNLGDFSGVHWADEPSDWPRCGICGFTRLTSCQGETFKKETVWLCEGCKEKWETKRQQG